MRSDSRPNSLSLVLLVASAFVLAFGATRLLVGGRAPPGPDPTTGTREMALDDEEAGASSQVAVAKAHAASVLTHLATFPPNVGTIPRVPVPETLSDVGAAALLDPRVRFVDTRAGETLDRLVKAAADECVPGGLGGNRTTLRFDARLVSSHAGAHLREPRLTEVMQGAPLPAGATECLRAHLRSELMVERGKHDQPFVTFEGDVSYPIVLGGPRRPPQVNPPQGGRD